MSVVRFVPEQPALVQVDVVGPRAYHYATEAPEFTVWRVDPGDSPVPVPGHGPRIAIVLDGDAHVSSGPCRLHLARGQSALLRADESATVSGTGILYVSGPGI